MGDVNGKCKACANEEAQGFFGNSEIWDPRDVESPNDIELTAYSKGRQAHLLGVLDEPVFAFTQLSRRKSEILSPFDKRGIRS